MSFSFSQREIWGETWIWARNVATYTFTRAKEEVEREKRERSPRGGERDNSTVYES